MIYRMNPIRRAILLLLSLAIWAGALPAAGQTTRPIPAVERVLIVSIDGLRPDVLLRADAPNLRRMFENGAFSFWAKTTPVSITLPSHASMLTGVEPETHGVTWNTDVQPAGTSFNGNVPSLFDLAKRAGYSTAVAAGKTKFSVFDRAGSIDYKFIPSKPKCDDPDTAAEADSIIRRHRPQVMFVHFAGCDNAGHSKGWGSPEQLAAAAVADASMGVLLRALDDTGLRDKTLIIVSADHGGAGITHGKDDPRSRTIPWIASGPGVRRGYDLTRLGRDFNVQTYDTFATACWVLGIEPPKGIVGKVQNLVFAGQELIGPTTHPSTAPATRPLTKSY